MYSTCVSYRSAVQIYALWMPGERVSTCGKMLTISDFSRDKKSGRLRSCEQICAHFPKCTFRHLGERGVALTWVWHPPFLSNDDGQLAIGIFPEISSEFLESFLSMIQDWHGIAQISRASNIQIHFYSHLFCMGWRSEPKIFLSISCVRNTIKSRYAEENRISYHILILLRFLSPASLLVVEHASCRSNHLWRRKTGPSLWAIVHLVACQLLHWAFTRKGPAAATYLRIFAERKQKTWHFLWILSKFLVFLVCGESPTLGLGGMGWQCHFFKGHTRLFIPPPSCIACMFFIPIVCTSRSHTCA